MQPHFRGIHVFIFLPCYMNSMYRWVNIVPPSIKSKGIEMREHLAWISPSSTFPPFLDEVWYLEWKISSKIEKLNDCLSSFLSLLCTWKGQFYFTRHISSTFIVMILLFFILLCWFPLWSFSGNGSFQNQWNWICLGTYASVGRKNLQCHCPCFIFTTTYDYTTT